MCSNFGRYTLSFLYVPWHILCQQKNLFKKILKFMKKKLAFFIAVLYNKSCVTENRIMYALLAQLVEQ